MMACESGDALITEQLIACGADTKIRDKDGRVYFTTFINLK